MSILEPQLNTYATSLERQSPARRQLKDNRSEHSEQPSLLQAIIEGFVDAVLILSEQGEWVHSNECAHRICQQLADSPSQVNFVPQPIWHICESLIESRMLFPDEKMIIEAEIDSGNLPVFRIRVRRLEIDANKPSYLLVTIEDRHQSTQNAAIAEAKKYGLTRREAEVWLLRRANYSYKEIAARLYITLNTVKKHMKSVYAKQQVNAWNQEEQQVG